MNIVHWIDLLAAITGISVAVMVTLFPRFGRTSWILTLFILLGSLSAGILGLAPLVQISASYSVFLALQCLLLCGMAGWLTSHSLGREDYLKQLRRNHWSAGAIVTGALVLTVMLYIQPPVIIGPEQASIALGPVGYGAALYLLLVSVIALANIEQTLRSTEDHVRWEIKFLWLGIGSSFGALIYIASQILIYPPEYSYLPVQAVRIFPIIFLCSCLLVVQSWRRGTARDQMVVSQSVIYSTITLVSVGAYLVVASLFSAWTSRWTEIGVPTAPVAFILSLVVLSILFLATAFRHRARVWIRQNIFAGRYDYRQFWLKATEQIRANESVELAASALVKLIQSAVGSIDLSVWVASRNSSNLRLVAARGSITEQLPIEVEQLADDLGDMTEPTTVTEGLKLLLRERHAEFLKVTRASILVPLVSSGRLVGLMTIGADRSGKQFDWQTREFLGAMAIHFANEFHKSELLATLVEAREAEAFQTFSTFLLHDLKNFATTLSLITKNAVRHDGNPDFQADAFESILELSEKMKRLCNNLRTFSATLAANKALDDVNQIVSSIAETFQESVGRRIQLDLQPVPKIVLDREEIVRVLQNLILNAHEASPEDTAIDLKTRYEPRGVVITVADHGHGMSAEFVEKALFQPFQTTKADGLGIGLLQSRKIVEAHDGTIEVDSVLGSGTVVRIVLPNSDPDHAAKSATNRYVSNHGTEQALNLR